MAADGPSIVKRYERLKSERGNFDERWSKMAPYIAPSRVGIQGARAPGEKQTTGVYDSTAMMAAEVMAQFIAGHVINPSQQWFGLKLRDEEIGKLDSVKEWLEESRDRMLKSFASSAFYAEGPESLIDYGGFGTGSLFVEEAPQPVNQIREGFRGFYFHADKIGRFVIAEGANGLVDTEMREWRLSNRAARDQWGEERLPESAKNELAKMELDTLHTYIHAVYPRERSERKAGAQGMPWVSAWVEKESKHLVSEGGYETFPAAVPRYQKTPGEVYGRGRGDLAFPDTSTLNTAKRMGLEDWALKIRPPVLTRHDSVIGTLRLVPAGQTSVNTHGQPIGNSIMPFQTGSHPEISAIKEEELRKSIRQIFYVDQILALLEVQKTEMTAYEYAKKIELLFRLLGPVYGRLEWEYLHRIIDIAFDIMLKARAFSPPPDEVFDSDGEIDVEFQNPIAKAQRAGDVEAITLAVNDLAPLAQVFPQVWDGFDPDKTRSHIFEIRGVPAKVARSEEEIAELRAARAEQQQAEARMAMAKEAAEAAGKAAPMAKVVQESAAQQGAV